MVGKNDFVFGNVYRIKGDDNLARFFVYTGRVWNEELGYALRGCGFFAVSTGEGMMFLQLDLDLDFEDCGEYNNYMRELKKKLKEGVDIRGENKNIDDTREDVIRLNPDGTVESETYGVMPDRQLELT